MLFAALQNIACTTKNLPTRYRMPILAITACAERRTAKGLSMPDSADTAYAVSKTPYRLQLSSLESSVLEALQLDLLPGRLLCWLGQRREQHVAVDGGRHHAQEAHKPRLPARQAQQTSGQGRLHTERLI